MGFVEIKSAQQTLLESDEAIRTRERRKFVFFGLKFKDKKTVKELRKNQNLTAKELADKLKLESVEILKIDDLRLKDISEPLKSKLIPILRGDYMENMTWL